MGKVSYSIRVNAVFPRSVASTKVQMPTMLWSQQIIVKKVHASNYRSPILGNITLSDEEELKILSPKAKSTD